MNRAEQAAQIMRAFGERTGVTSNAPQRRYLWTDAYAVSNYLSLWRATRQQRWLDDALRLVDLVHAVLGRFRPGAPRQGWISGLPEDEAQERPTAGGLRIGKPLEERAPGEPMSERQEWDRDGQYFHYLTRWMQSLDQLSRATDDARYNAWARELAVVAHRAFVHTMPGTGGRRMYWKLSVDLSRAQVTSMGQHDALDGYVTAVQLRDSLGAADPALDAVIEGFAELLEPDALATDDPLGLGALLVDAARLTQLHHDYRAAGGTPLLGAILTAALAGLSQYTRRPDLGLPAESRLAFRELGLAIGLKSLPWITENRGMSMAALIGQLGHYGALADDVETFWLEPFSRRATTWSEHLDMNEVMLATSLVPEGFLAIFPGDQGP